MARFSDLRIDCRGSQTVWYPIYHVPIPNGHTVDNFDDILVHGQKSIACRHHLSMSVTTTVHIIENDTLQQPQQLKVFCEFTEDFHWARALTGVGAKESSSGLMGFKTEQSREFPSKVKVHEAEPFAVVKEVIKEETGISARMKIVERRMRQQWSWPDRKTQPVAELSLHCFRTKSFHLQTRL